MVNKFEVDNKPLPLAYSIHFAGKSLAKKDGILGKSDPFLMIATCTKTHGREELKMDFVAKTEWIKNDLNPVWKPLTLSVNSCNHIHQELAISVYDYDSDGTHVSINLIKYLYF